METLTSLLLDKPNSIVGTNEEVRKASLKATKELFEKALQTEQHALTLINNFLKEIRPSQARQTRSKANEYPPLGSSSEFGLALRPTPLSSLYVEDMDDEQVWNQLELRADAFCKLLQTVILAAPQAEEDNALNEVEAFRALGGEDEQEDSEAEDGEDEEEEEEEDSNEGEDDDMDFLDEAETSEERDEHTDILKDPSSDERDSDSDKDLFNLDRPGKNKRKQDTPRHPELDDGFFSLSEFNAETEEAEARDSSKGKLGSGDDGEEEEIDDIDIFRSVEEASPSFDEEDNEEVDPGQAHYTDFFAPLPKSLKRSSAPQMDKPRQSKVKFHDEVRVKSIEAANRGRSAKELKMQSLSSLWDQLGEEDEDEDVDMDSADLMGFNGIDDNETRHNTGDSDEGDLVERASDSENVDPSQDRLAIERFKDDLFGDDEKESDTGKNETSHEARLASIAEQISLLEEENVGPRDWTLMGEATSRKRPHNSLLEQDLDFEHVQRPVSIATTEQITSIEDLIKKRILENNFDDVERKRPIDEKLFLPSRFFELQDSKSKQSLSAVYEDAFVADKTGQNANSKDVKLQKEHEELEQLWERITGKLDALCNAHFTPRPPKATIFTVSNVASASLESSLPTSEAVGTMLAPEEVFAPSSSDLRDKSELTPSEKRGRRSKERKARAKTRQKLDKSIDMFSKNRSRKAGKKPAESKGQVMKSVVKAGKGIRVIGGANSKQHEQRKFSATNLDSKILKL